MVFLLLFILISVVQIGGNKGMNHIFRMHQTQSGMTLIETLVGGAILILVIVSVSAMIGEGSSISKRDILRRRAFQEMNNILERVEYSSGGDGTNYAALRAVAPGILDSFTVLLDTSYSDGGHYRGTMQIAVAPITCRLNGSDIPTLQITVRCTWSDPAVQNDSLAKVITYVRG